MFRHGEPDLYLPATGALPGGGGKRLQRILVPVDPFGRAGHALAMAAQFSAAVGGQLRLVHVRMWDPAAKGGYPQVILCLYDLERFGAEVLMDALRTHPMVIVDGMVHDNPYYIEPGKFLARRE
jgi:nucleotide-binding universal stress UspA family protein